MATINPVVLPLKVLKDGTNRLRIAVRHRQQTSYIVTNIRLDNEKQLKNGKIVRRPDAAELNKKLRAIMDRLEERLESVRNLSLYTCVQLKNMLENNVVYDAGNTFKGICDSYVKKLEEEGRHSYATLMQRSGKYFCDFCMGDIAMEDITPSIIRNFIEHLKKSGKKDTYINIILSHVKVIVNRAVYLQIVSYDSHPFSMTRISPAPVRDLDLPLEVRRKMWFKPFMQSYLVVFIGYLTMYLIRKNFNIAQNDMISTYGLSMTQLGMIGLGFSITYGVGKTLVSYYADGKNTKQFLPFMLILSAICMLGFSASMGSGSVSLFLMIAFYALSGFFQSTGGSCSYSTITKWTPRRKRGTFLGFWNISHNLGGAGAAGVALFGANYLFDGHVIGMFIFPSIIALIVGFIGLRYGSDSPESYGLGKAEELFGEEISEEDKETESTDMTKWQIFVEYVLKNKVIWLLCFANIFLYVVRIGIDQWSTVYAFQELKLSKAVAIQGFTLFEAGALVGTLLWGWLSDLANGRRGLVACIALALIIATLGVYQHASNEYIYLASLFALGFLVFGPQLLIGVAAVGFVPKKAIGAADGIKGTFAYLIGDSFAKLGLGMIADGTPVFGLTGWAGTFAALDIAAIGCICLMAIVAVMEERKIRREKKIQQLTVA